MACAALAEHELTGTATFHGLTPSDTRSGDAESLSVGWFASLFPVTAPIVEGGDFPAAARAAQASFDANRTMAAVPVQRVLDLASAGQLGIEMPNQPPMMLSYMDFRKVPAAGMWRAAGFGLYGDKLSCGGVNMWINRADDRTTLTVSFPDNTEARRSVQRYLAALSAAFADAAATTADWIAELNRHANDGERSPARATGHCAPELSEQPIPGVSFAGI